MIRSNIKQKFGSFELTSSENIVCILAIFLTIITFYDYPHAAVPPNGQEGACGPYYLWYQDGPVGYQQYFDICGIIFDISDVVDDFDFVYFADNAVFQRTSLDHDRDGFSDWSFIGRTGNLLEWRPEGSCVRITQRGCEQNRFNPACGYAMIQVQPRRDSKEGNATIPVRVVARCPPDGRDCSKRFAIPHAYSNCGITLSPGFVVLKEVGQYSGYGGKYQKLNREERIIKEEGAVVYIATVYNAGDKIGDTTLSTVISEGTNGGALRLTGYRVDCPPEAVCTVPEMSDTALTVSLTNIAKEKRAIVKYYLQPEAYAHPSEKNEQWSSKFTITHTLSTGGNYQTDMTLGSEP